MEPHLWEHVIPLVQVVTALITAIWAVFKIKTSTERLGDSIDHLRGAVGELKSYQKELAKEFGHSKERVAGELSEIKARLAVIENRLNN